MAQKLDFQVMATTLMGAVNESIVGFLKTKSDKDPEIITRNLYADDKLDVSTYAEFIDGSYISVIYFYHNRADIGTKRYCGMFILYISTSVINYLVKVFGYKNSIEAGNEVSADAAAELCNNIAGVFKNDLSGLGYPELEISTPFKFKGFSGGIDYPKGQRTFHRITAFAWGQNIYLDVILTF